MSANQRARIAVLLDHIESEYPITILLGVMRAARLSRARVFVIAGGWLAPSATEPVDRNFIYDFLHDAKFDGIIVLAGSLSNYCGIDKFRAWLERLEGVPTVALGLPIESFPSVYVDNGVGIRAAVSHLIEQHGRRRIAFIAGPAQSFESNARFQAYKQALAEHDIPIDERLIVQGGLARRDGIAGVATLLDERRVALATLNAIAAVNDDVALGVMEDFTRRRIGVPDPVAVVGFDDTVNAGWANPPLTTVNQRVEHQGYTAARTLLLHLEGRALAGERLQPELVLRASCGCSGRSEASPQAWAPAKSVTKSCRLALIERRATFLAEVSRAGAGRLSGTPKWEEALFDALGAELDATESGKFVRQLEKVVRQNALSNLQLTACHDVLTTVRLQALQCAVSDVAAQLSLEQLFQEARLMVARVSADVQSEHRHAGSLHLRIIGKECMAIAGVGTLADLEPTLTEQLPMLGIGAFSIAYFTGTSGSKRTCQILAHRSSGLARKPSSAIQAFEVGLDPSLDNEEVIIVEPLELAAQPLGVAAFCWGAFDPFIYEQLREMLGVAVYFGRGRT